ncbi:MAG: coenzyme F420 hydrogenase [Firmicutes bacterium HGW-Firmicutes-7]|nr:MAG: coenzyme F420 hydrogenase [Firmicutes bacterium HGW-Firmicutes-7]
MTKVDYGKLKKDCFINQVEKEHFALRIKVVGGQLEAKKLKKVYEIAEEFGRGYVHMTSRQSIEIPFISLKDIAAVKKEMETSGLERSLCGPTVRTITACQGKKVCTKGLIDTTALAEEFDERYYSKELPHKFKLGITGCRNNCLKAEENDLGVKGGVKVNWHDSDCSFCGLCEKACPSKAIEVDKKSKRLTFNEENCINCGRCVKACPTNAWEGKEGFILYFGGLFGNKIAIGKQVLPILFNKEDVHKVVEATLSFFVKNGKKSERFRNTVDRVGWGLLENAVNEALQEY